jgi:hypothetical protein
MKWGRMAVLALAVVVAAVGLIAVVSPWTGRASVDAIDLSDDDQAARRDENELSVEPVDDDDGKGKGGDGDNTRGDDGTNGGNNTGDGDNTRGDDGTNGGNNTGGGSTGGGATT